MKIEYRQATPQDAELLVQIYNASYYSDHLKYGECPGYGKSKEIMEESIIKYPKFVILCDSEAVGCISCNELEENVYEIGNLCIVPEFQGKGLGTQAIQFVKKFYKNWKKITLVTPIDKTQNVKFYMQKCGFKIVSKEKDGKVELARFVLER